MADASRFRAETVRIARKSGWKVVEQAYVDQFTRRGVAIEVVHSAKDFIRHIVRDGPGGEHSFIPYQTTGKVDLLRFWLTGRRSNVIHPSVKRAAGVDW